MSAALLTQLCSPAVPPGAKLPGGAALAAWNPMGGDPPLMKNMNQHVINMRDWRENARREVDFLAWNSTGDKIYAVCKDHLRLIDAEKMVEEQKWGGEFTGVDADPTSPHHCAASGWNGRLRIVDQREGRGPGQEVDLCKAKTPIAQHLTKLLGVAYRPDGKSIAVYSKSDHVQMINIPGTADKPNMRLAAHTKLHEVYQVLWDASGETFWTAQGGTPGLITVHGSSIKEEPVKLHAHASTVACLARDPKGRFVVSGGGDGTVCLWDVQSLQCRRTYGYATQEVTCVSVNHDGSLLAFCTGSTDSKGGENNFSIANVEPDLLLAQPSMPSQVTQCRWHPKKNVLALTCKEPDRDPGGFRDSNFGQRAERNHLPLQLYSFPTD